MPKPNRTERRLHWWIELFKLCWAAAIGSMLVLLTLKEGWAMTYAAAAVFCLTLLTAMMGFLVFMAIRKLPDE